MFVNSYIGLVMICNGICNALCSYIFGDLVKYIGRIGCFIIATILNYASIIVMYFWEPVEDQMYVLFIIAGMWGVADAVWQSQVVGIILFYIILICSLIIHFF
jgi:predicted MFS family arabinose efflux permease